MEVRGSGSCHSGAGIEVPVGDGSTVMEHACQFLIIGVTYLAGLLYHTGHKEKHERRKGKAKQKSYRL